MKDDGIGVHVIDHMDRIPQKNTQEFLLIDGGTCPDILLNLPQKISTLIVIDAAKGGSEPGTVYRFQPDDIVFNTAVHSSLHQLGLGESLALMRLTGEYPERVVIIGIEPKEISWGLKISPELENAIPTVVHLVSEEVAQQGRVGPGDWRKLS